MPLQPASLPGSVCKGTYTALGCGAWIEACDSHWLSAVRCGGSAVRIVVA